MQTNPGADGPEGIPADARDRGLPRPVGDRVQQLCQGIVQILASPGPRQAGEAADPLRGLQAEAGRILLPHLEDGLRALTEFLREDLLVRITQVKQLERLTGLEHDSSSISRVLGAPSPEALVVPGPPLLEPPLPRVSPWNAADEDAPVIPAAASQSEHSFDAEPVPRLPASAEAAAPEVPTASRAAPAEAAAPEAPPSPPASSRLPASAEADLRQAAENWRQGAEESALALCFRAIRHHPDVAEAYLLRGQMYARRGEHRRAVEDFTAAIALRPHLAQAHLRRSDLFLEMGELDRAREGYSTALELQPDLADAYLKRGAIHLRQSAWGAAIADADAVLRQLPGCARAYFLRGSAYFQYGDPQRALADLDRLLELEPKNAVAYNERGLVLAGLGKHPQALADFARALRLEPGCLPARFNRARALWHQGELDLALAAFTELIQLAPDNALAHYHRAQVYRERLELDPAIADCTRALELQPQLGEAAACLRQWRRLAAARRRETLSAPAAPTRVGPAVVQGGDAPGIKPAGGSGPGERAHAPLAPEKGRDRPSQEPAGVRRGTIPLTCTGCGTVSRVGIDRLNRRFQCRKCQGVFEVQSDGRLSSVASPRARSGQLRHLAWKGLRPALAAGLFLLVLWGGWRGWHGLFSSPSLPALSDGIEPRAEMLVKAWIDRDSERVQMLTTPAQEGRIQAWLKANPFPLSAEEFRSSRAAIEVRVLEEAPDRTHLGIQVNPPSGSPVNVEQQWVRAGNAWYFQPYPEPQGVALRRPVLGR